MRILFLAPFAAGGPKGTTRWRVLPLARALSAYGHTVCVLVAPYDRPAQSGLVWFDKGVEVRNIVLPPVRGGLGYVEMARRLANVAVTWQPDLVHCFKPKGPAGLAAWLLDRLPGWSAPLVMDADDWEAGWNRQAGYPPAWQLVFRWQEQWGLRRADAVTAASRWLVGYAGGLRAGRHGAGVTYLPNGVEPVAVSTAHRDSGSGMAVLAYTRFVEHTPEMLVGVWRRVLAAEPEARMVVAGTAATAHLERLVHTAEIARVSHSILTVGWTPAASRAGLFAAVDLGLLPVHDTPLTRAKSPMRLLDLLAAGVPVVTQAVGEYGTLVENGVTGLVVRPGDDEALAAAVVRLLGDRSLRQRLGQAAAISAGTEYAWPVLARAVLASYAAILAVRTSRHLGDVTSRPGAHP